MYTVSGKYSNIVLKKAKHFSLYIFVFKPLKSIAQTEYSAVLAAGTPGLNKATVLATDYIYLVIIYKAKQRCYMLAVILLFCGLVLVCFSQPCHCS